MKKVFALNCLVLALVFSAVLNSEVKAEVPQEYLRLSKKLDRVERILHLETPTFSEVDFLHEQLGGDVENIFLHARMNQVELHFLARDKKAKKYLKHPRSMFSAFSYGQLFMRMAKVEKYLKEKSIQKNNKNKNLPVIAKNTKR